MLILCNVNNVLKWDSTQKGFYQTKGLFATVFYYFFIIISEFKLTQLLFRVPKVSFELPKRNFQLCIIIYVTKWEFYRVIQIYMFDIFNLK